MCGGSIFTKLLPFFVSGALAYGLKSEETAEVPSPSYEDGYMKPGRLGAAGAPRARSSPPAARARTAARSPPDKSAEWIVALRSSLMRDNYDYQPMGRETLAPLAGDSSGETSAETRDSSGDTSGGDHNGRPSAQDYDRPTPKSLNHNSPSKDHSFRARHVNPILKPSRLVHQNISRKHMYRDSGLELPTLSVPHSRSSRRPPRGRALAALTMPPRTAQNAALIDEINEQFEAKRRNYLESLYELEDQLRPVYAGGSPRDKVARAHQSADRRGGDDRGSRNHVDDAIKPDSLPYIGHDGIRRYKVFKNEIEKFKPFVEDYLDYRNNHKEAGVAAELIPWHKNPQKNQDPMTELHQEAFKMMDNVKTTFDVSSEYVQDRKPQPSGRKGTTKGNEWYTKRHHGRRKQQRSMYLESGDLPDIDSEDSVQRQYNSRRDAELLDDSSDVVDWSPSSTGLNSSTSST